MLSQRICGHPVSLLQVPLTMTSCAAQWFTKDLGVSGGLEIQRVCVHWNPFRHSSLHAGRICLTRYWSTLCLSISAILVYTSLMNDEPRWWFLRLSESQSSVFDGSGSKFIIRHIHSIVSLDKNGISATNTVTFSHLPGIGAANNNYSQKLKNNIYILYVYMF